MGRAFRINRSGTARSCWNDALSSERPPRISTQTHAAMLGQYKPIFAATRPKATLIGLIATTRENAKDVLQCSEHGARLGDVQRA